MMNGVSVYTLQLVYWYGVYSMEYGVPPSKYRLDTHEFHDRVQLPLRYCRGGVRMKD